MSRNKAKKQSHNARMRLKRAARYKRFKYIFAPTNPYPVNTSSDPVEYEVPMDEYIRGMSVLLD